MTNVLVSRHNFTRYGEVTIRASAISPRSRDVGGGGCERRSGHRWNKPAAHDVSGQRERASPYQPSDRRYIDPIYLDVSDGADDPAFSAAGGVASAGFDPADHYVRYSAVWAFKRAILERRFAAFVAMGRAAPPVGDQFRRFVEDGGIKTRQFATFQAIAETREGESWRQ